MKKALQILYLIIKTDIYFILGDGLASFDTLDKYYDYKAEPLKNFS